MFGTHPFAPLAINILVTLGIALLLRTVQVALDLTNTKKDRAIILFLSLLIIFTTNILGYPRFGLYRHGAFAASVLHVAHCPWLHRVRALSATVAMDACCADFGAIGAV